MLFRIEDFGTNRVDFSGRWNAVHTTAGDRTGSQLNRKSGSHPGITGGTIFDEEAGCENISGAG
jgi:hypothetical protein